VFTGPDGRLWLSCHGITPGANPFLVIDPIDFDAEGNVVIQGPTWNRQEIKLDRTTGKLVGGDKVMVSSDAVASPIAVRYAWGDNPVFNLYSNDGLPVTPFRTDDFEMITQPKPLSLSATKQ